jgi:hypothetical protein
VNTMKARSKKMVLLKKHYPLLRHIAKCSSKECGHLIAGVSDNVIKLMSQICVNLMNKNLVRDESHALKRLKPYRKELVAITKAKTPLKKKRQILQQKGGFIGALLSIALPILSSLIGGLVSKK